VDATTPAQSDPEPVGLRPLPFCPEVLTVVAECRRVFLRYGKTDTAHAATVRCLRYSVFGPQHVTVVLLREDAAGAGYDLALVTTDLKATAAQVVERYAARWCVEVAIEDAKQLVGVGQAGNRVAAAVERTVPFGLACQTLAVCWYATAGHHPDDVTEHRARAPWYRTKTQPSIADMLGKLRRVLIAARFRCARLDQPTSTAVPGTGSAARYGRFLVENEEFLDLTRQRVASYWNCYHRRTYPTFSTTLARCSSPSSTPPWPTPTATAEGKASYPSLSPSRTSRHERVGSVMQRTGCAWPCRPVFSGGGYRPPGGLGLGPS